MRFLIASLLIAFAFANCYDSVYASTKMNLTACSRQINGYCAYGTNRILIQLADNHGTCTVRSPFELSAYVSTMRSCEYSCGFPSIKYDENNNEYVVKSTDTDARYIEIVANEPFTATIYCEKRDDYDDDYSDYYYYDYNNSSDVWWIVLVVCGPITFVTITVIIILCCCCGSTKKPTKPIAKVDYGTVAQPHTYAQPQQVYVQPQQVYAQPQQVYAKPQQFYAQQYQPQMILQAQQPMDGMNIQSVYPQLK